MTAAIDPGAGRLPVQPLIDRTGGTVKTAALRLGIQARHLHRLTHTGLSLRQADHLAVAAGLHPVQVWPDWYQLDAESTGA